MPHCDTHLYPANIFISEDFPAPCGPITAVSSPDGNIPDMFLRIRVSAEIILKVKKHMRNRFKVTQTTKWHSRRF